MVRITIRLGNDGPEFQKYTGPKSHGSDGNIKLAKWYEKKIPISNYSLNKGSLIDYINAENKRVNAGEPILKKDIWGIGGGASTNKVIDAFNKLSKKEQRQDLHSSKGRPISVYSDQTKISLKDKTLSPKECFDIAFSECSKFKWPLPTDKEFDFIKKDVENCMGYLPYQKLQMGELIDNKRMIAQGDIKRLNGQSASQMLVEGILNYKILAKEIYAYISTDRNSYIIYLNDASFKAEKEEYEGGRFSKIRTYSSLLLNS